MATPTMNGNRPRTQLGASESLFRLVLTIFLIPAPFELINAFAKRESYDFQRLAIVLGGLAVLAFAVAVIRPRRFSVQSAIGVYLIVLGAVLTAVGVVITFRPSAVSGSTDWPASLETALSALTPSVGLLLLTAGVYLVRDRMHRTRENLESPSPTNVMNPRPIRVGERNGSLWTSAQFGLSPGSQALVDICTAQLSTTDLHYVAYFTNSNECLFYVDVLDDEQMRHFDVRDTPNRRRNYELTGRHMRVMAGRLDRRLQPLESGIMVRMVWDVEKGALFFYNLHREGFLVGVTLDQTEVDPTDRKLSALANEILVSRGGRPDDDFYRK